MKKEKKLSNEYKKCYRRKAGAETMCYLALRGQGLEIKNPSRGRKHMIPQILILYFRD